MTSKGQVTIPLHIRERLGILPNTEVEFEVKGDAVPLRRGRARASRGRKLVDHMRGRGTVKMTTDEIMALTRGE